MYSVAGDNMLDCVCVVSDDLRMNECITSHNLDFEAGVWPRCADILIYRIGTCEGQWMVTENAYCIISVINNEPGNGHLEDVFEWFEHSCKRDKKALMVLEVMNKRFGKHLLKKRGFVRARNDDYIKEFNE